MYVIYFIIAIFATTLGAATGMGGGVIIKPALDMLGHYDEAGISMLASATVFVMAAVSLMRQRKSPDKPKAAVAVPLAVGAVLGGNLGSLALNFLLSGEAKASNVTVVQNAVLAALIIVVFIYMLIKRRLPSLKLTGAVPSVLVGLFLGVISSFLGIGGGPINVALIIFVFGFATKTAALCSLLTILFSQGSKLLFTAIFDGFSGYDLSVLPVMLVGAVAGGLIGGIIHKRADNKTTDALFNGAQVVVFCMCIINILRNI